MNVLQFRIVKRLLWLASYYNREKGNRGSHDESRRYFRALNFLYEEWFGPQYRMYMNVDIDIVTEFGLPVYDGLGKKEIDRYVG